MWSINERVMKEIFTNNCPICLLPGSAMYILKTEFRFLDVDSLMPKNKISVMQWEIHNILIHLVYTILCGLHNNFAH